MSKSNTFVFDLEWYEILKQYPSDVRMEVYEAIMEYAQSGKLPELKPIANMAFSFIRPKMDYNRERYEETVEKRKQAGAKGGKAKNAKKSQANPSNASDAKLTQANEANASDAKLTEQKQANASDAKQTQANEADNVYDSVYDKYYLERVDACDEKIREAYLDIYFSDRKQISLDELLKKWETSREELRQVCEEVLMDWTHEDIRHPSVEEAKRFFHNAVRKKYSFIKSAQNGSRQGKPSGKGSRPSGARDAGPRRNALDSQPKPGYSLDG